MAIEREANNTGVHYKYLYGLAASLPRRRKHIEDGVHIKLVQVNLFMLGDMRYRDRLPCNLYHRYNVISCHKNVESLLCVRDPTSSMLMPEKFRELLCISHEIN